jgi:hypothetical protein
MSICLWRLNREIAGLGFSVSPAATATVSMPPNVNVAVTKHVKKPKTRPVFPVAGASSFVARFDQ